MRKREIISEETVVAIFNDIHSEDYTYKQLQEKYNVSMTLIKNIRFMRIPWLAEIKEKYHLEPK